jgi:hypothetical protein
VTYLAAAAAADDDDDDDVTANPTAAQGVEFDEEAAALEEQFGAPCGQPGQWAACIRIVDPATLATAFVVEVRTMIQTSRRAVFGHDCLVAYLSLPSLLVYP